MEKIETVSNFAIGSTLAQQTDATFWFIFFVSLVLLVGITVFMLYCCVRYNRKNNPKATQIHGSLLLEVLWTVIPTILVLFMFWMSWEGYAYSREVPEGAYEINVYAKQWQWSYEYPQKEGFKRLRFSSFAKPALEQTGGNEEILNEPKSDILFKKWTPAMVVPVNTPIKLNLIGIQKDVIHSFSVPAFRIKGDCTPKPNNSTPNYTWFNATKVGLYDVFCTEFCGTGHSQMNSYIKVVTKEEFDIWYDDMTKYYDRVEQAMPGTAIFKDNCAGCHSTDGTKAMGPTLKDFSSHTRDAVDEKGRTVTGIKGDLSYFSESIRKPKALTVIGFGKGLMPSTFADYTDEQIQHIYEYLESIK